MIYCEEHGVPIDYVNENAPERMAIYGNDCRKISADIYIDDKNVCLDELAAINSLQSGEKSGIIQERKYLQDPKTGKMMGSTSDGMRLPKSMSVGKKEYSRLNHQIFSDFPSLKGDGKLHPYENRNHFYLFSVHEPGAYELHYKIKIDGNEALISSIRKDFR